MIKRVLIIAVLGCGLVGYGYDERFDGPVIGYHSKNPVKNDVSRLEAKIRNGEEDLTIGDDGTALEALLAALRVPKESQVLVFSKTSLQTDYITPSAPRAIYFNDDIYVGTVKGSPLLEISAQDGDLGAVFYTYDPRRGKSALARESDSCLRCHSPRHTEEAPAHIVRSVYPDNRGFPLLRAGSFFTDESSAFDQRWGGWYVTGRHQGMVHMGNVIAEDRPKEDIGFVPETAGGRTDLSKFIDTDRYLTPHSDIIALMVLEHQAHVHNLITLAGYQTRLALGDEKVMDVALKRGGEEYSPLTKRRIEHYGDQLVRALVMFGEVKLPGRISGDSGFAEVFMNTDAHRDGKGRSLRDLDLEKRLLRYPCSYLVYSEAFDAMPDALKTYVYRKLYEGMVGDDMSDMFMHVDGAAGRAVVQILRETKKDLPKYWFNE